MKSHRTPIETKHLLVLAAVLIVPAVSMAQTLWTGGTSDFNNPASWNGTYIGGSNPNCSNDSGSNNVVLIEPGDVVWQHGDTLAGNGAGTSGSYLQTGSTNNTGGGNWLRLGLGTGSYGQYVLSNGVVNVGGRTQIGENGIGYLEIDGGTYSGNVNDGGADPGLVLGQGDFGPSPVGTMVVNGGVITIQQETWVGEANGSQIGTGHFFMHGGTINLNSWFVFGRFGGRGDGYMDGGTINKNNNGNVQIGVNAPATASFTQLGGVFNCASEYQVAASGDNTVNVTNNIGGTAVLTVDNWFAVGRAGGYGTLNISGSAAITKRGVNGGNLTIGGGGGSASQNAVSYGIVNQTSGTFTNTATQTWIGETGQGFWNLSGGWAVFGTVYLSANSGALGTLSLNGGDLIANEITAHGGSGTLNLNGGTIHAGASVVNPWIHDLNGSAGVQAGGVTFDTAGNNLSITEPLVDGGGGGVTKIGSGTLTLPSANGYSGPTIVNAGTLTIGTSSYGGGAVTVANTAGFGLTTQSGNGQLNVASLTIGGATGASLSFDLGGFGNPSSAPLNVAGAFTANGTITVNVAASVVAVGTIPLIQYGSLAGSATTVLGSLPPGVAAHLATSGNTLELVVTSAGAPRWDGQVLGQWDLGTNQDWFDLGTLMPTTYSDGKPVVFDDSAAGTTTVDMTATVKPASINFNNNNLPYTLVGPGLISGATGVNLNGAGTVAILNNGGNNFTGRVVINAGVLSVTNLANGGSPSALGASSSDPTNLVINGGTLSYGGAPVSINRSFTVGASNATVDAESNLTVSGRVTAAPNPAGGGSGFTKTGPAQLALTTVGTNEFANGFNPGAQVQQGTLLLDGSGGQTNHTVNDFYVGDTTTSGAALILSNTTLNVDGWLGVGRINGGINNTSTITIYNSTVNSGNLTVGWDGGLPGNLSSQVLTLNGSSTLTDHGDMNLVEGTGSSATITINDTAMLSSQNRCFVAWASSSTSAVTIASSGRMSVGGWYSIAAGQNSLGSTLVKDNGSLNVASDLNICDGGSGATGSLTVQGNATAIGNTIQVGKGPDCNGTLTISGPGAAVSARGAYMTSATGNSGTIATITIGSAIQPGGSLNGFDDFTLGQDGTAVLNMVANGGGTLTVPGTIYLSRGSAVADGTVNLNVGSTIVAGYVNNGWGFQNNLPPTGNPNAFNFNGGTLKSYSGANPAYPFIQPFVNVVVQAGGAVIDDNGAVRYISAPLVDGGGGGGLTKLGAGTLALLGANTYTGTTVVSAGALAVGPGGVIAGPMKVASGATLAGDTGSIESFSINNTLTLSNGCRVLMQITPVSNDQITGLTSVSYGGSLVVSNSSATPLTVGSVFKLLNAASAGTGNFSSVTLLPAGSATFNPATGELTITAVTPFTLNPPVFSGGNLILTASGGTPGGSYTLLTSTNITTPLTAWTTNSTGSLDGSGGFSNSIPINTSERVRFFDLRMP
ncbi:MAG TPA: autotransporter-associated beta strand repeat-containing protein [Candidatus Acidoferrum sp.]|nr:autotransporter-associated beta strand repeat-containing protein [Candidatus Acidoferrum sp.]